MIKSVNASYWVQRWSELQPEKTAVLIDGQSITYKELFRRTNRVACWLQAAGIEKGDRIAVLLDNCIEFLELYLASSLLGAIFVPFNFRLTPDEVDYLIRHSRPRLFIYSPRFQKTVNGLQLSVYRPPLLTAVAGRNGNPTEILDYRQETEAFDGQVPFITPSLGPGGPEEPQVIMYTSGTTGRPRGAVLSHRKTFFNCLNAEIFFQLAFDDVMLITLPLFHSGGLFIQASPSLYKGATMLLHRRFDAVRVYQDIERFKVTKFLGVPTIFRSLLSVEHEKRSDISSLRVCAVGGEKVASSLLEECWKRGFPLRQIMGQTETSILLWASEQESIRKPGTSGKPVFHAEVALIDSQGRLVGPGQVGEIVVRGSIMMKEYWQDPEQTERVMAGGWLRTGDLARKDEDGYYYLMDRVKEMYISGAENVYPAEVERVLKEYPGIEDAAVVGVPDAAWGEVGHAFVICRDAVEVPEDQLLGHCREKLAGYKVPKRVTFCREFPRTPLGKVRKFMLLQMASEME